MELGERIRQARQEAGMSQRQLCGDRITRNMLSQIEHGTARPSMDTLRYLAERLGKTVSFFLEEQVVISPNQHAIGMAQLAWAEKRFADVRKALEEWHEPDPVYDRERKYLLCEATLALAELCVLEARYPYARELLEEAEPFSGGDIGMERRRLLLLGRIPGVNLRPIVMGLPSLDEELLLRAEAAMEQRDEVRASALLAAVEDRENPRWHFLRGQLLFRQKEYLAASEHFRKAETAYPEMCVPVLETCFRELGDYKMAYEYACRQR